MYVRLAFAVNIMSAPEIMIVDEALAVGDIAYQAKCMTALSRIQENGSTVLFVSHDIDALKSLCTRSIYLENSRMQEIGPAGDVAEHYIRRMREEMNAEYAMKNSDISSLPIKNNHLENQQGDFDQEFKKCTQFESRVFYSRYGTGRAKITFAELLDEELCPISTLDFDQSVFILDHFEA